VTGGCTTASPNKPLKKFIINSSSRKLKNKNEKRNGKNKIIKLCSKLKIALVFVVG